MIEEESLQSVRLMSSSNILDDQELSETLAESKEMHQSYIPIFKNLMQIKDESKSIMTTFEDFKEETMHQLNKAIGKISSLIQREIGNNVKLREELEVVTSSNQTMRKEVVQLREMIEEFVKSYNAEIEAKDIEIRKLKEQLGDYKEEKQSETFVPYEDSSTKKRQSLEIIQEVSEYTVSCTQSIRDFSIPNSAKGEKSFDSLISPNKSNFVEQNNENWLEEEEAPKKSKSFLKCFRKNVDESVIIEEEKITSKDSHTNSVDDLFLGETDKVNVPKIITSPKHMQLLKKHSKRLATQEDKENNCIELKTTPHRRNLSEGNYDKYECKSEKNSRSSSKAGSKEKIKLASKIMEDCHNFSKNNKKCMARPSVHLGGKMYLKKVTKEVRTSLQEYKVWEGVKIKEVKYEGEKRNGMRWGKGTLLYDNGFEYSGSFVQNYKHGMGTVSLNGIVFYEGQWSLDEISGQGYIKSLKNFSENCPKYLWEASYCGQLLQNKPHGMGTLFLNQNEKIVTKFVHGVPVGDFTYYNHSEIEFSSWF